MRVAKDIAFVENKKRAPTPGGEWMLFYKGNGRNVHVQTKGGVCLVCDLFHILTLSRNNSNSNNSQST